jgi:hypothetical protein
VGVAVGLSSFGEEADCDIIYGAVDRIRLSLISFRQEYIVLYCCYFALPLCIIMCVHCV